MNLQTAVRLPKAGEYPVTVSEQDLMAPGGQLLLLLLLLLPPLRAIEALSSWLTSSL
jgi:hypothetical protein